MSASPKTSQLQIRVSAAEKAAIQRAARLLPPSGARFQELTSACGQQEAAGRFALAELNAFLSGLAGGELRDAVLSAPTVRLAGIQANYIAAMVESACARCAIDVPTWTGQIPPLASPYFGSQLESLRLYLLTHSPPAFRRRNIFIDASIGAQV